MRNIIVIILFYSGFVFSNCNKEKENNEKQTKTIFLNEEFKNTLDRFIDKSTVYENKRVNEILIELYLDEKTLDTLMLIDNYPVTDLTNLVFSCNYEGYKLFFYAPEKIRSKLYSFVEASKRNKVFNLKTLEHNNIDTSFQEIYVLKKDSIEVVKIPIEIY